MAKQFNQQGNPDAWIVSTKDRGRKSIKNGKVFLKNDEEFEIELFNPLNISVLADIKLNRQSISKNGLVIKPGQRIYLDCFIDDRRKFIFKTYEVENTTESLNAISDNGVLEVFFYRENIIKFNNWTNWINIIPYINPYSPYTYPNTIPHQPFYYTNTYTTDNITYNNYKGNITNDVSCNCIETGRVEMGNMSNQKFTEVNMDFESFYISSTIIHILPESRKPSEFKNIKISIELPMEEWSNDDIKNIKKYIQDNIINEYIKTKK